VPFTKSISQRQICLPRPFGKFSVVFAVERVKTFVPCSVPRTNMPVRDGSPFS
jgi:hypothetical protein